GRQELALGRVDAALALDRLDQDAAGVRAEDAAERVGVVQLRERDRREQRLERGALRRLPGRRERARRPPVERALERDDARLARGLARVLERGLVRLRARVAEEGLCTAEARREPLRQLEHRLRPVEVRD